MNTILTDEEIDALDGGMCGAREFYRNFGRAIEAAVLAKLREQEPKPVYLDNLIDRLLMPLPSMPASEVEKLMAEAAQMLHLQYHKRKASAAAPLPAVVQVPQGNDLWAGKIAYQLTKKLVIDMPTARAAVDAAIPAASEAPATAVVQVPQDVVALLDDVIDHAWNDGVLRKNKLMDDRTLAARQKLLDALAAAPEAPVQGSEWLPLTPEEQNRLDGLLKHARWLMQSMPATDGLQHSWALNAHQAMQRMHDWLKAYLPPAMPNISEAVAQNTPKRYRCSNVTCGAFFGSDCQGKCTKCPKGRTE